MIYFWLVLSPLLFYYQLLNNPHVAILQKGYSFSKSVSAPISIPKVFLSSFLTFVTFTYLVWRGDPDGIIFIRRFSGTGDN